MRLSPHFIALKKYVGERNIKTTSKGLEVHRCHFRVTEWEKEYIVETAAKLRWSANHLCNVMIEKSLPLVEMALFRSEDEYDCDIVVPRESDYPRVKVDIEHIYSAGDYKKDVFMVLTRETFLMLQYLKEHLHFYSYGELFRLILWYFYKNLDVSDIEYLEFEEDDTEKQKEEKKKKNKEKCTEARERLRAVVGLIDGRLAEFRCVPKFISTIVPINLARIRSTAACLSPETQIFLEKMVI